MSLRTTLSDRWHLLGGRPWGVRWSQMVFGRRETLDILREHRQVVVSVYLTRDGRVFYAACRSLDPPAPKGGKVLYRIRVKLKDKGK